MKEVQSPQNIPSVINLLPGSRQEERLVKKRSRMRSQNKTGDGKTILPHSEYRDALEKVIRRDFFPEIQEEDSSVVSSQSTTAASLGTFHEVNTSDRHVRLHNRCTERSNQIRIHAERKYHTNGSSSITVRNPVFFGPPQNGATPSAPMPQLLEAGDTATPPRLALHATRLPARRSLPPVPNHWEGDEVSVTTGDDVSDATTNLDSTVVASLQSEIRQARMRGSAPHPSSDDLLGDLPFGYELPRSSAREAQAAVALERRRKASSVPAGKRKAGRAPKSLGNVLQIAYSKKKRKNRRRDPRICRKARPSLKS